MKDIAELNVTQVRIYPPDKLPFFELCAGPNIEAIRTRFSFRFNQQEPPGGEVTFSQGLLSRDPGVIVIHRLSIDPRRITLHVRGSSSDADAVQSALWDALRSFVASGVGFEDSPLTKSDETVCVATLAIDTNHLLAPSLMDYLSIKGRPLFTNGYAKAKSVEVNTIAVTIKYDPIDQALIDRGISVPPKAITLQPRAGTIASEHRFYIASPTDSETHLELLRGIEANLSGAV